MRLIISGSRSLPETQRSVDKLDAHIRNLGWDVKVVLCGMARGADRVGEFWANQRGVKIERYPANWGTHGRRAGFIRNEHMARMADGVIALWDGESRGTKHMIQIARKLRIIVAVRRFTRPGGGSRRGRQSQAETGDI